MSRKMQLPTQTEDDNPVKKKPRKACKFRKLPRASVIRNKEPITLLRNLKELVDLGILTPEEFDEKRKNSRLHLRDRKAAISKRLVIHYLQWREDRESING